jgi:sterol 14alpha-demethylase
MQRVIQEQDTVVGGDRDLTFDDINNMPLLHNCMREALRLHPPLVLLMRKVLKDLKVKAGGKDYVIPKGDVVMVSPSVGMRLESVFPKGESLRSSVDITSISS